MPRPKYQITKKDLAHAKHYLISKLQTFSLDLGDLDLTCDSKGEFFENIQRESSKEQTLGLNAWCEKYLPAKEWTRLKTAIRKRRERKTRFDEITTITVSKRAHSLLSKLAKRDKVTLSEAIERNLPKLLQRAPTRFR